MVIVVFDYGIEKLVVIIEFKKWGDFDEDVVDWLCIVKCDVVVVIFDLYGLSVVDFVLVLFGLIFIIISGKIRWV